MLPLSAITSDPTYSWLTQGGSIGILAGVVVAFMKGWIVSGGEHRKTEAQRDRAMEQVYKLAEISQRAVEASERVRQL